MMAASLLVAAKCSSGVCDNCFVFPNVMPPPVAWTRRAHKYNGRTRACSEHRIALVVFCRAVQGAVALPTALVVLLRFPVKIQPFVRRFRLSFREGKCMPPRLLSPFAFRVLSLLPSLDFARDRL